MSLLGLVVCILVVVFVVWYFKNLSQQAREDQTQIVKDSTIMATFTVAKVGKELAKGTAQLGELTAKSIEKNHSDTIKSMKESLQEIKDEHDGSAQRAGIHFGEHINEVTGINAVNKWSKKELDELSEAAAAV